MTDMTVLEGHWGRNALGQSAAEAIPWPKGEDKRVYSVPEFIAQKWDREGAIAAFTLFNNWLGLREKIAHTAYLGGLIAKDARLWSGVTQAPAGTDFIKVVAEVARFNEKFSDPTLLNTVQNGKTALEVTILPKNFGIEVRGFVPLFRDSQIQKIQTGMMGPMRQGMKEILDFGDLTKTSFLTDAEAVELAGAEVKERFRVMTMGMEPVTLILVIAGVLMILMGTFAMTVKPTIERLVPDVKGLLTDPAVRAVLEALQKTDPAKAAEFIRALVESQDFWTKVKSILAWTAVIGVVALLGGGLLYLALK